MSDTSTSYQTAVTAASTLKLLRPSAWDSLVQAHTEAGNAHSLLIEPSDILLGILLNTLDTNVQRVLQQLDVKNDFKTTDKLRMNRTVTSAMKDILLSNLYGNYRSIQSEIVGRTTDQLLKELSVLQDELMPRVDTLAETSINSLLQCGMSEDEAKQTVNALRDSTMAELNAINALVEQLTTNIQDRSLSVTGASKLLCSWMVSAKKGILPPIKADAVRNIFSRASQQIFCLARQATLKSSIGNEHLLLAMAADTDGPGNGALAAISIEPSSLSWLIRNTFENK